MTNVTKWYVVHTLPRGEEIALQNLQAQGFDSFLPRYHKTRRHARKMDVVVAPLFPRYLFVSLNLEVDRWSVVNSTRGVAYILRQHETPIAVRSGVIEELKKRSTVQEIVPLSSLELFKPGVKLEILEGAFAGYTGVFEKMADGERVQLLLNFLGNKAKMTMPVYSVAEVA